MKLIYNSKKNPEIQPPAPPTVPLPLPEIDLPPVPDSDPVKDPETPISPPEIVPQKENTFRN